MRREFNSLVGAVLMCGACGPALAAEPSPVAAAPAAAPAQLDIFEFVVDGNSVLPEDVISETLAPFLGPGHAPSDVDAAREALENAYRQRGYKTVSVSIPRQTVRDGSINLQVTEGRVGHLNVVGSRYHSLDRIREQAPSMAEGRVPDFNEVKDDIVALNQQPDRRVTPALKAGATPGTVDIDLAVSDDLPLHGMAELNNRRSQGTSSLRSVATLSYDNLWQREHSLSLSYQTAPQEPSEAKVWFGSYLARFPASPFSLLFNALKSDSAVATVGGVNVLGKGRTLGLRGLWTLPTTEAFYQSLTAGVDYKHYLTSVRLAEGSFETPITYYPFVFGYTGVLHQDGSLLDGDLSLSFAAPKLGSGFAKTDVAGRTFARGQQLALRGGLSYTVTLPAQFEALLKFNGQWTDQPLITNEQLSAGGADSVRGYYESESLGDYGVAYTAELRGPTLATSWLDQLQPFVFHDGAYLRLRRPTSGVPGASLLDSAGAGLNLKLLAHLNAVVDWAVVLDDGPFAKSGSSRWLFRVWGSF